MRCRMTPSRRTSTISDRPMRAINFALAGAGLACSLAAVAGALIH
jgi:hypothetical protein